MRMSNTQQNARRKASQCASIKGGNRFNIPVEIEMILEVE